MPYSRWRDAQQYRMGLLALTDSPRGMKYIEGFQASLNAQHPPELRMPDGMLWHVQRETVRQADPVYVSGDVTELIDVAREDFDPEPVFASDLFTPNGLAVFPRSIKLPDHPRYGDRANLYVRAVGWLSVRPSEAAGMNEGGVWVSLYTHVEDDLRDDTYVGQVSPDAPGRGVRLDPRTPLVLAHQFQMAFNRKAYAETPIDLEATEDTEEEYRRRSLAQWLLPQVLWRIGSQVVQQRERLPRPMRRELRRMEMDGDDVTIIRLRREAQVYDERGDGEGPRVRFIVRGHWRNQWYPSIKAHRQIWIAPYVKGPEYAELRLTERVYEFVR